MFLASQLGFGPLLEIYSEYGIEMLYLFFGVFGLVIFSFLANKINALWLKRKEILKEIKKKSLPKDFFFHSVGNGGARFVLWHLGGQMIKEVDQKLFFQILPQIDLGSSLGAKILQVNKWFQNGAIQEDMREALTAFFERLEDHRGQSEGYILQLRASDRRELSVSLEAIDSAFLKGDASFVSTGDAVLQRLRLLSERKIRDEEEILFSLAHKYFVLGNIVDARKNLQEAFDLEQGAFGARSQEYSRFLGDLALCDFFEENYQEALGSEEPLVDTVRKYLIDKDPNTGTYLNALGKVYLELGRGADAVKCYEEALSVFLRFFGEKHLSVSDTFFNLGEAHQEAKMYGEAIKFYEQSLNILQRVASGYIHFSAITLERIGICYYLNKNYEKSIDAFQKSLNFYKDWYGDDHSFVARASNNFGGALFAKKEFRQAMELYQRALSVQTKILGEKHLNVAITYSNLGGVWKGMGQYPNAIECYDKAIEILKKNGGEEQAAVAVAYDNLAGALRERGDFEKAFDFYTKSIAISQKIFGDFHPSIASCYNGMGKLFRLQKQIEKSREYHQKAMEINISFFGKDGVETARTYENLARVFLAEEKPQEALPYLKKALEIFGHEFGPQDIDVRRVRDTIALLG